VEGDRQCPPVWRTKNTLGKTSVWIAPCGGGLKANGSANLRDLYSYDKSPAFMKTRTRFAPSPTGDLHVGGARTALFSYLEAKHLGGEFILRIEDTDLERSTPQAVKAILDGMQWLGLSHDDGPYYQTQRFARYREVAEKLLQEGKAYRCYCSKEELETMRAKAEAAGEKPRYNGYWRDRTDAPPAGVKGVIRFKNPQTGQVVVNDRVRGTVVFDNAELDDLVIWRSDDAPTYNFAVVVDDADMGVTAVIRGDDHLNNTPRQINIYHALGLTPPSFAHLPMILGPDGAKLSKRHGAVNVMQYRSDGFLPHAMLNYLVRLGWSFGDQEIFSMPEMIALFSADRVNHSASRFDLEKLTWLNHHYIKTLAPELIVDELRWHLQQLGIDEGQGPSAQGSSGRGPSALDLIVALRERCPTLKDMAEKALTWFQPVASYDVAAVAKQINPTSLAALKALRDKLAALAEFTPASIHAALEQTLAELGIGMGKLGPAARIAITGNTVSPALDQTIYLAGHTEALARIDRALTAFSGAST
jgi:glutamyl-tRNA synthetase